MKERLYVYAGNFLFALNFFILFILLFESRLQIPPWLQPVGRMHVLLLHFPIVLLLISMVMEFFPFKSENKNHPFFNNFTSILFLVGVMASGVTVVMGLFLSKEGGYGPEVLGWHKWWGVSVFFFGSMVFAVRKNYKKYDSAIAKSGAVVIAVCLIFTGHFGATLTHGESFIWKPIVDETPEAVPIDQAKVFDHLIKPILESKCVACHNPDKLKGKLVLTDSVSIWKGGKSGKLFVAGNPENSLLMKRIHLQPENKKHMPPSGNTQLTKEEKELLHEWIKSNATFNQRIVALPLTDSLRLRAIAFLNANDAGDESFDFEAADDETVEWLNTDYRVVSPVAKNSPALSVNIYSKENYSEETLSELMDVKVQIVSLELSKMPITQLDLKNVAKFENLRRLNLNFTDISGEGLATLAGLKKLKSLSLSGTSVNYHDLKKYIPDFENLSTVALWKTELTADELMQLQADNKSIQFLGVWKGDDRHLIKLNPPRLKHKSAVFDDSIQLQLFHPVRNVTIHFTTDGSEPDSTSQVFNNNTVLKKSTAIQARAYKLGWLHSDVALLNVYRSFHKPDSILLLSRLNRVHPANGSKTFFDHQLGTFNANSPAWANNWAGFNKNDMELLLEYKTPKMVSSIALNTLIETETSIFPPAAIEIWGGVSPLQLKLITHMMPEHPKDYKKPFIQLIECPIPQQKISYLKIIAKPVMKLPGWHKNKAKPALLLVDEVLVN
jgi:uncharacterized membrane protein